MEHFMVELFVRGLVLCLLTALALLLLRRTAAAFRHLICVLALCGLLTLPLVQRLMPPLQVLPAPSSAALKHLASPMEEAARAVGTNPNAESPFSRDRPEPQIVPQQTASLLPPDSAVRPRHAASIRTAVRQEERSFSLAAILTILWGIGTATLLIRLMVALFRLRRLEVSSRKAALNSTAILVSERIDTPLTWGLGRNIILMPAALLSGDPAVCESALRHEQAHIARWDWVWNLLAECVCAFCWFQPGVWWLRRRMRLESERACDDRVLLSGIAGPDYAAHLLQILRSVRTNEVAPAMAHIGGIEERMKHILDTNRPRRARTIWLAVSAPFALALLSFAGLRVSARPAEAKPFRASNAAVLNSRRSIVSSQPSNSPLPETNPGPPNAAELLFPELPPLSGNGDIAPIQPGAATPAALPGAAPPQSAAPAATPFSDTAAPVKGVVWGESVNGLQPGFLLTTPGDTNHRQLSFNSKAAYQVLVRNTTRQDREIEVQCQNFTEMDPYLIPNADIRQALGGSKIPESYRSLGVYDERLIFPAYPMRLAPGEAVILPEVLSLYVGDLEKENYPRIEQVKMGLNWIVQPIAIRSLTPAEAADAVAGEKSVKLTMLSRDGRPSTRFTTWRAMPADSTRIYAKIRLEIGTLNAENLPANKPVPSGSQGRGIPFASRTAPGASAAPPGAAAPQSGVPAATAAPPDPAAGPVVKGVIWGDSADGLQAGFLLKTHGDPANLRIPFNSQVTYRLLVRNTTRRDRTIEVQCQDFNGMDPCFIPDGDLRKALGGGKIPDIYRVSGVTDLAIAFLGSAVKLAPGEAVILPEVLHLYIGDGDKQNYPRIEQIEQGRNWIVQPVKVRSLTPAEAAEDLASVTSPYGNGIHLTILTRDGGAATRLGARRGIRIDSKILYAKMPVDIAAVRAENSATERPVHWGEKAGGFQLGARIETAASVFQAGDTITFKAFGRNLSGKDFSLTVGRCWKVNYKIQVQTIDGKPIYMERTGRNNELVVAGYMAEPFGHGSTLEISEAKLKILRQPETQLPGSRADEDNSWVEAIPLKPGRYRVRLLSWGVFGTRQPAQMSGWIPIEVKTG